MGNDFWSQPQAEHNWKSFSPLINNLQTFTNGKYFKFLHCQILVELEESGFQKKNPEWWNIQMNLHWHAEREIQKEGVTKKE